jgi:hypothetical protein
MPDVCESKVQYFTGVDTQVQCILRAGEGVRLATLTSLNLAGVVGSATALVTCIFFVLCTLAYAHLTINVQLRAL